ncbi:MAG: hypothetical protein GX604_07770 [Actinobacteria bacterium]|nr:hypothetical protein [Actinomycetota bacterium]
MLLLGVLTGCGDTSLNTAGRSSSTSGLGEGAESSDTGVSTVPGNTSSPPQIGVNSIRFFWTQGSDMADHEMGRQGGSEEGAVQSFTLPDIVFADFAELGVQAYRQFFTADLLWDVVEPRDDDWQFERADAVLMKSPSEPIVTLFSLQYASPNPPWATSEDMFQKTLGAEARDYLTTVVKRYAPYVRYWELGNEMDHWRIADPEGSLASEADPETPGTHSLPSCLPVDGFTPQEQGAFLAEAAALIRELDPDAVILMPGMSGLDTYQLTSWLPGLVEGGGSDWFDIVGYHYYLSWFRFPAARRALADMLMDVGLEDKSVWLTETGSSASFTLSQRTNYPNSARSQAADIFRRVLPAYAAGDDLVLWHTYIGSPDTPDNSWRCYGLRDEQGRNSSAYASFQLLTSELMPVDHVEALAEEGLYGCNAYRVTTGEGAVRYVVWGAGVWEVPSGMSEVTEVVVSREESFAWHSVSPGEVLILGDVPLLLR